MPKDKGILLTDNFEEGTVLDIAINVARNEAGLIVSGLTVGNTLQQNKALLLMMKPGDLKTRPDIGVGIGDLLMSSDYLEYRHRIREHFAKDGLTVTTLNLYENKPIRIDAEYNS